MHLFIKREATGSPESFATKMGLSRSTLLRYLNELKDLGAPLKYDYLRQTYFYDQQVVLEIGFKQLT
jgi:predicted DNA-binding transcriptional regulator YafY